jgi:hypothetical protein
MSTEREHDDLPHIDLNALVRPVATVELDEASHDVLPVQGEAMSIFEEIVAEQRTQKGRATPPTAEQQGAEVARYLDRARRIVYAVAPSIPHERVKTMTAAQLTAIAGLSMGSVKQVQALRVQSAGKGSGPANKRTRTRSGRK